MVPWTVREHREMAELIRTDNVRKVSDFIDVHGGPDVCVHRAIPEFGNALMIAIQASSMNVIGLLLGMGADPNASIHFRGRVPCTLFQAAIFSRGHVLRSADMFRMLLGAGADLFGTWPFPTGEDEFNAMRLAFCDVFGEGTCNLQAILHYCCDASGVAALESIRDPRDPRVQLILRDRIFFRNRFSAPTMSYTTALGSTGARDKVNVCRKLVVDFGLDVNTFCIQRDPTDDTTTEGPATPSDLTLLGFVSSLHSTFSQPGRTAMLHMAINAGGNPLMRMHNGASSLTMVSNFRRRFATTVALYEQNGFQPNTENALGITNTRDAIACMQAHARFRLALRILRAGQGSPGSVFSMLGQETMMQVILCLAPRGALLSHEQIAELYQSRRPWFTSAA
jgi:hypothetical protein